MTRRRADGPPSVLPFFLNAELQELGHLGTTALGAHWRLTYWVWSQGKAPQDNDDLLARIARVRPAQWRGVRVELLTVWQVVDGQWQHERLLDTMDEANGKRRKNSGNGKKGGHAKSLKYKKPGVANGSQTPPDRHPNPSDQQDMFQGGEPDDLWEAVKRQFPDHLRRAWLDNLTLACVDDGVAYLSAPSRFVADRVQQQMAEDIRRAFAACGAALSAIEVGEGVALEAVAQ